MPATTAASTTRSMTLAWVGARHHAGASRDERDRRAAAERRGAGKAARDPRFAERRPGHRRRRGRLERDRVRKPRGGATATTFGVPTSTRRSGCGATCGPDRPSRSPGRFHTIPDFAFGPLPDQAELPIVVGGRDERALRRAGTLADGYHSSATGPAALRRADPGDPGRGRSGRPADAVARGARARLVRRRRRRRLCDARLRPTRSRPRCVPSRPWASRHLALGFATTDPTELADACGAVRARGHTAGVTAVRYRWRWPTGPNQADMR